MRPEAAPAAETGAHLVTDAGTAGVTHSIDNGPAVKHDSLIQGGATSDRMALVEACSSSSSRDRGRRCPVSHRSRHGRRH